MVEAITTIDKAGRVVIPKEIRERMNLGEDSALLVAETDRGVLILKKLDIKEIADRLRVELKGKDVDEIARRVEEGSNERVRKGVRELARLGDAIVAVQQGNVIGTAFHPELGGSSTLHEYLISLVPGQNAR
jgi:AbrB family looped-hinge helix DNA binding protein